MTNKRSTVLGVELMVAAVQSSRIGHKDQAKEFFISAMDSNDVDEILSTLKGNGCPSCRHMIDPPPRMQVQQPVVRQPYQKPQDTSRFRPSVIERQNHFTVNTPRDSKVTIDFANDAERDSIVNTISKYIGQIKQYQLFDNSVFLDCNEEVASIIDNELSVLQNQEPPPPQCNLLTVSNGNQLTITNTGPYFDKIKSIVSKKLLNSSIISSINLKDQNSVTAVSKDLLALKNLRNEILTECVGATYSGCNRHTDMDNIEDSVIEDDDVFVDDDFVDDDYRNLK